MPPINNGVDLGSVHEAYQKLYNALTNAYWATATSESKDEIHVVMDVVFDIISQLNRESLEANSDEFKAVAKDLKDANDQLMSLKGQIDELLAPNKSAVPVAAAIDKAISLAVKYFGQ